MDTPNHATSQESRPVLVFATHNPNKVKELLEMLGHRYRIQSLTDIGCHEEIVEDASTLEGNAQIKAQHVVEHYGPTALPTTLDWKLTLWVGLPGLERRYAGTHGDAEANMSKLLHELDKPGRKSDARKAQFRTVICLVQNGREHLIEGTCRGSIATERSGAEGFGYDPIFIPEGHDCSFADMTPKDKNAISHRGRAVQAMVKVLLDSPLA